MYFCGMKPYRFIHLSDIDHAAIVEGRKNGKTAHFRLRCHAIELSHRHQTVPQIAFILEKRCETIRYWFTNWEQEGLLGLGIKPGRGLKPRLDLTHTDLVAGIKKKSKNSRLNS